MRKEIIGHRFRNFFMMLLILALGTGGIAPVFASEAVRVTVPFGDPGCSEALNWEFPYSDEWFFSPDDVFNRELAKRIANSKIKNTPSQTYETDHSGF